MSENFIFKALSNEASPALATPSAVERHLLDAPLGTKLALMLGALTSAALIFGALAFDQPLLIILLALLVFSAFKFGPFKNWYQAREGQHDPFPSYAQDRLGQARSTLKEIDMFLSLPHFTPNQEFKDIIMQAHTLLSDVTFDLNALYQRFGGGLSAGTLSPQALVLLSRLDLIDDAHDELLWLFRVSLAAKGPAKDLSPSRELETTLDSLPFKCNASMRFGGIYE